MVFAQSEEGDLSRLERDSMEEENSKVYIVLSLIGQAWLRFLGPSFGKTICLNIVCEQYP